MKNLTFYVQTNSPKQIDNVLLLEGLQKVAKRSSFDLQSGLIEVKSIDDCMVNAVIELINKYYPILTLDVEEAHNTSSKIEDKDNIQSEPESNPILVALNRNDETFMKKIKFQLNYVERLLRTCYWAMDKKGIPEEEIGKHIMSATFAIQMNYNPPPIVPFSIGDVVHCNYGSGISGEIQGGYVASIVCNIDANNQIYLIPLVKRVTSLKSKAHIAFECPKDIVHIAKYSSRPGGVALINKARYVRAERIVEVIGQTTPEFFERVLKQLPTTFDFSANIAGSENLVQASETSQSVEETICNTVAEEIVSNVDTHKECRPIEPKAISAREELLNTLISNQLDQLNSHEEYMVQIDSFIKNIGMDPKDEMLVSAFHIGYEAKKAICYDDIIPIIAAKHHHSKSFVRSSLRDSFDKWLRTAHQDFLLAKSRLTLTHLINVFTKRLHAVLEK